MPNGRTHRVFGGVAGGGLALARAQDEAPEAAFIETCGGVAGGIVGGSLPDILEPATSPRHRSLGHSMLAGLGVSNASLGEARIYCRGRAEHYRAVKAGPDLSDGTQCWYALLEMLWRFLAGALSGLQAGYCSHLALDSLTPSGLPVIA